MVFTNPASANDERTFEGTLAEWNALTLVQKTFYTKAIINNDYTDNPVGNLNALTTTDKSSCVGAINEVNAYHTRHYGTPVEITSASTSDLYTCPSDGFVTAEVNSASDTSTLNVIDYDLNVVLITSGGTGNQHQIRNGCNVIKGQRLYNNIVNAAGAKVQFIPLVNS